MPHAAITQREPLDLSQSTKLVIDSSTAAAWQSRWREMRLRRIHPNLLDACSQLENRALFCSTQLARCRKAAPNIVQLKGHEGAIGETADDQSRCGACGPRKVRGEPDDVALRRQHCEAPQIIEPPADQCTGEMRGRHASHTTKTADIEGLRSVEDGVESRLGRLLLCRWYTIARVSGIRAHEKDGAKGRDVRSAACASWP